MTRDDAFPQTPSSASPRPLGPTRRWLALVCAMAGGLTAGLVTLALAARPDPLTALGPIELETRSEYSLIRVRRHNNFRTLTFVRDSGQEVLESQINLQRPHDLTVPYTRSMFLSYVFLPQPKRVLIVGLGGGAMVHFLKHHDPQLQVDVVEIDPVIVQLADSHFGIRSEGRVTIFTEDAFDFLARTENKYDVIYMDAFLKPANDTDSTGVPLRLKTESFYRGVQSRLTEQGVMVFNINAHERKREDLAMLAAVFPQTYVFRLTESHGLVAVGTLARDRRTPQQLQANAAQISRRFRTSFSFPDLAKRLQQ